MRKKHEVECFDCSVIISAVGVVTKRVGCSSFCSKPRIFYPIRYRVKLRLAILILWANKQIEITSKIFN